MKTIIVHHRSSHHAKNSGYSRLIDFLPEATKVTGAVNFPYRLAKLIGGCSNQKAGMYDSSSVLKEFQLYKELKKDTDLQKVVHYLNAERDIRYVVKNGNRFKNTFYYGTFHKPPTILKEQITQNKYLKNLNGAIAVGVNQVEFLKNWLEKENVQFIPHGVDTQFFIPDTAKRNPNTLLFVGQHLRDFEAFNYCIPKIAAKVKDLTVNVILKKEYFKFIDSHSSINLLSNIDDEQLKNQYQKASALFLPLKDSTACNSILEALACGIPIVTTDVGGNSGYLNTTNNILAPKGDHSYLIEATIALLNNEGKQAQLQKASREKALEFDWEVVAKQIATFYKQQIK